MAVNRSFTEYVKDRFYNELYLKVENYIEENLENLDLRLYKVRNIGGIELSDIEVKFVSVSDFPDMKIAFDVAIEAELEVRESDYHYDESENCRQWFMIKCSGDLSSDLDDFEILSTTEYNSNKKQQKPTSNTLCYRQAFLYKFRQIKIPIFWNVIFPKIGIFYLQKLSIK